VAEVVGDLLSRLGRDRQVLCITHLAQVAAAARHHWRVAKTSAGTETLSSVEALDAQSRVDEIARMLGGARITAATRQHAEEMLGAAAR
jgi:DNA repair protein RecN (Recombination protein N)